MDSPAQHRAIGIVDTRGREHAALREVRVAATAGEAVMVLTDTAEAAVAFVAAGVFANVYPFAPGGYTEALTALHLPIALWLVVGIAYTGGRWGQVGGRMDFIRFSGELFIYYVLIALGGGVLLASMRIIFQSIGIDVEPFF